MKIALLGATSHIAKGLIYYFHQKPENYRLYLFARNLDSLNNFINKNLKKTENLSLSAIENFDNTFYDIIINCVGVGDPAKLKKIKEEIFFITELYDNKILTNLKNNPESLYINFSSGAVYGKEFEKSVQSESSLSIQVNQIEESDYYTIAKLNSEAKHRALKNYSIIDLRVFSYFSRFIDLDSKFFMTDVVNALINKTVLETNDRDMIRDFVSPEDLFLLVEKCLQSRHNAVYDVYSLEPVSKFKILDFFKEKYKLNYIFKNNLNLISATGKKNIYYSNNKTAERIGYLPRQTSLESLEEEINFF
ncbi:MAG: hypothetical protein A2Y41_06490 [Spirochaetes bacterium GWB1_36_13]|nr:MAG: hypothetical protein A2Y41_06490 [Spirochaetes bacterium GWB1_36_13]